MAFGHCTARVRAWFALLALSLTYFLWVLEDEVRILVISEDLLLLCIRGREIKCFGHLVGILSRHLPR